MGEVTGLQLSGNDYDITREITGVLPDNVYGKSVRLVMMANYESRGVALVVPGIAKYADWKRILLLAMELYLGVWLTELVENISLCRVSVFDCCRQYGQQWRDSFGACGGKGSHKGGRWM